MTPVSMILQTVRMSRFFKLSANQQYTTVHNSTQFEDYDPHHFCEQKFQNISRSHLHLDTP